MNILSNNENYIMNKAKEYSVKNKLELIIVDITRENMNSLSVLYRNYDDLLIVLKNVSKTVLSGSLLKLLEDCNRNISLFAVCEYMDVTKAIQDRFDKIVLKKLEANVTYKCLQYYINIADNLIKHYNKDTLHKILMLNSIVCEIKNAGTNVFWDGFYYRVQEEVLKC